MGLVSAPFRARPPLHPPHPSPTRPQPRVHRALPTRERRRRRRLPRRLRRVGWGRFWWPTSEAGGLGQVLVVNLNATDGDRARWRRAQAQVHPLRLLPIARPHRPPRRARWGGGGDMGG